MFQSIFLILHHFFISIFLGLKLTIFSSYIIPQGPRTAYNLKFEGKESKAVISSLNYALFMDPSEIFNQVKGTSNQWK